jgi:hypothetical protein
MGKNGDFPARLILREYEACFVKKRGNNKSNDAYNCPSSKIG